MKHIRHDRSGKEAFAYLAVILMVLSGAFLSYHAFLEKEMEKTRINDDEFIKLSSILEEDMASIKNGIISLHDASLIECQTRMVRGSLNGSLDGQMQLDLERSLEDELKEIVHASRSTREGYTLKIAEISIDPVPITRNLETPVPSTNLENSSGLADVSMKPSVIGINTSFQLQLEISNEEGTIRIKDDLEMYRESMTLFPMVNGRFERFEMGIYGTDFPELFGYIAGSLAQMKCLMGYGRKAYGGGYSHQLLSEREVLACSDLALALLASSHLHGSDSGFLKNITSDLRSAQGAGEGIEIADTFQEVEGEVDPSMMAILGEGIFSETNPPPLEMLIRPILSVVVDGLLMRMLDFIGMGDELYTLLGGISQVFQMGKEIANSFSSTILGREIVDTNERSAEEIMMSIISSSKVFKNGIASLMNRKILGITWNGGQILHYPLIELPDMNRTFQVALHEEGPQSEMYLGKDGSIHSKAEYYDPQEEFLGWNSTLHSISAKYEFGAIEPMFQEVVLKGEDLYSELAVYLGTISVSNTSAEEIMMEKGKMAIRNGIEGAIDILSDTGSKVWEDQWTGWDLDEPPDLNQSMLPISQMVSLELDPLSGICNVFSKSILDQIDLSGFMSLLYDTGSSYRTAVASFIKERYDHYAGKNEQIDRCLDNGSKMIMPNATCFINSQEVVEEGVIIKEGSFPVSDPSTIQIIEDDMETAIRSGLDIDENGINDMELDMMWAKLVSDSYHSTFLREMGNGDEGTEPGYIWSSLLGSGTRSGEIISVDLDPSFISNALSEKIMETLRGIENAFYLPLNTTSGRMLCHLPVNKNQFKMEDGFIDNDLCMFRLPGGNGAIIPQYGTYYTDPLEEPIPYRTGYEIHLRADYQFHYAASFDDSKTRGTITRSLQIDTTTTIEITSMWEMSGLDYHKKGSLFERLKEESIEALGILVEKLEEIGTGVLGDTMSSLREVPPLIMDLIEGNELDLAEIARVISNVTMDASSTIREGVKGAINKLVDMGISTVINSLCSLIGIDKIDVSLELGAFDLRLYSERDALQGGEGNILTLDIGFDPIGMSAHLSFSRIENGTLDFNGTLIFDLDPLYIKVEMDPFMMRMPHMISIEGRFNTSEEPVRFALKCPDLEEYRSCEISLGSSLGVEPFIPIPPLGINAVLDAGFRLRYKMPDELGPHLNEVEFNGGLNNVEIYNPREWPMYGSTIMIQEINGPDSISWRIEEGEGPISLIEIGSMDIWSYSGDIDLEDGVKIFLRDPSGIVLDDVEIEVVENGWYSRDADGYGVWRWREGSPGSSNSLSVPGDIKTVLISIAISSLKEAWEITYEEYGLSFDMVVPFLQTALDLFMERFLAVVRELVIDVMMFLDVLITDSSGTAGSGLEIFFSADGEAVADFFEWLYDNLKIFIMKLTDPTGAGDYTSFPMDILQRCRVGIMVFSEVEMPIPIEKLAPPGINLPDSFRLAIQGSVSLSFPMKLLGMEVDGFVISLGVYIMEAPAEIVSLFYEVSSTTMTTNLWLLRIEIWQGG